VAIAALVLWISTVAIGTYLLATATRIGKTKSAPAEPVPVSAGQTGTASADLGTASSSSPAGGSQAPAAGPVAPPAKRTHVNKDDRFAPASLQAERDEPVPGMKELAEFAHPALALIGLGFWIGYVISRDRIMLAIGLGIVLGAITAGLSWFTVNRRAAKRAAADIPAADDAADDCDAEDLTTAPLSFTPLVLTLHTVGAALTLLFVVLIFAHV
jgi:multisubunit Na+/H+ antiporter MnhC subunit